MCHLPKHRTGVLGAKQTLAPPDPRPGQQHRHGGSSAATGGESIPSEIKSELIQTNPPRHHLIYHSSPAASYWEILTALKYPLMSGMVFYQYHTPDGYDKSPPDQGDAATYIPQHLRQSRPPNGKTLKHSLLLLSHC